MNDGEFSHAKAAIIGARGIGRHHANWWRLAGADVVAIAGTSTTSLAEAVASLAKMFPFKGRLYTDIPTMLAAENPDFVDVCSPAEQHAAHVRTALEAGCHVLCEKPFIADTTRDSRLLLDDADALIALAAAKQRRLSLCSQYYVVGETCLRLMAAAGRKDPPLALSVELASPGKGRTSDPLATWIDLGSHGLAATQAIARGGRMAGGTLRVDFAPDHARCSFDITRDQATPLACHLHVFRTTGEPAHVRRVTLDGAPFDVDGERGSDGVYRARITHPGGRHVEDDPMFQLIRRTLAGDPPIAGPLLRQNLEWLLAVADAARNSHT